MTIQMRYSDYLQNWPAFSYNVLTTGATPAKIVNKMSNPTPTYKQPKAYNTSDGIGR